MSFLFSHAFWWLILAVVLVIIEAETFNFVTIWFAVGALAALITSTFTDNLLTQGLVFAITSAIALFASRPLVRKLRLKKAPPLNADRNIGRTATVIEAITPEVPGRVNLDGVNWSAKAFSPIAKGEKCTVLQIESTLLTVEVLKQNATV